MYVIPGSLLGSNPLLLEARSHRSSETSKTPFFLTINATWTIPNEINFVDFDFENGLYIFSSRDGDVESDLVT